MNNCLLFIIFFYYKKPCKKKGSVVLMYNFKLRKREIVTRRICLAIIYCTLYIIHYTSVHVLWMKLFFLVSFFSYMPYFMYVCNIQTLNSIIK